MPTWPPPPLGLTGPVGGAGVAAAAAGWDSRASPQQELASAFGAGLRRLGRGDRDQAAFLVGGRGFDLRHHVLQERFGRRRGRRAGPVRTALRRRRGRRWGRCRRATACVFAALQVGAELVEADVAVRRIRGRRSASGSRRTGCARSRRRRRGAAPARVGRAERRMAAGRRLPGCAVADVLDVGLPAQFRFDQLARQRFGRRPGRRSRRLRPGLSALSVPGDDVGVVRGSSPPSAASGPGR